MMVRKSPACAATATRLNPASNRARAMTVATYRRTDESMDDCKGVYRGTGGRAENGTMRDENVFVEIPRSYR